MRSEIVRRIRKTARKSRSSRIKFKEVEKWKKPKRAVQPKNALDTSLHAFQMNNQYCDITVLSADGACRLNAHRVVLAAKMAAVGMKPIFAKKKVMITPMDAATLRLVVDYCYTNEMPMVDDKQIFKVLKFAKKYGIVDLIEQCKLRLNEAVNATNAVRFWVLSKRYRNIEMFDFSWNNINHLFMTIAKEPSFNELTREVMIAILGSGRLHAPNEEAVFGVLLKWLTKSDDMDMDRNVPKILLMDSPVDLTICGMLTYIRFPLMSAEFFKKYAICVCEKMSRLDLVAEYFGRHITWSDSSISKRITPRVNFAALTQVEWPTSVESEKIRILEPNVAYYDDHHVAVFSGRNISMRQVKQNGLQTPKLFEIPLNEYRSNCATVFFNQFLYVAGGTKWGNHLKSVERYDFIKRKWESVKPMSAERSSFSMVVLRGLIYAIGGESKQQNALKSVEVYDPETNDWTQGPAMNICRKDAGIVIHEDKIYAICGAREYLDGRSVSVERYDVGEKKWTMIAALSVSRTRMEYFFHNNCLAVNGGFDAKGGLINNAEIYDEKTNRWTLFKSPQPVIRDE